MQINVSATDLGICRKLLERQMSFWYEELDEIVLSVESKKSYGRFAAGFDQNREELTSLIEAMIRQYPKARYHLIDYSAERNAMLSELFFTGSPVPHKDYHGGPFYCYFDGLAECKNQYVIHLDSDILLGGVPNTWLQDGINLLNSDPAYLIVNPLAGPPTADFSLKQEYFQRLDNYKFLFRKMSTRIFLTDKQKLRRYKIDLKKIRPSLRNLKWFYKNKGDWGYELPEKLISETMERNDLLRVDFFTEKADGGCFTLHPVTKPPLFIESIPSLLEKMDTNVIPESQRGYYNINNDFFDFSKAK